MVGFFEVFRPLFVARQEMVLHDSMAMTVQFFFLVVILTNLRRMFLCESVVDSAEFLIDCHR